MDPPMDVRRIQEFSDILSERKHSSDITFMTRKFDPLETHVPRHKTDPDKIKRDVFNCKRIQDLVCEIQEETGKTKPAVYLELEDLLEEIGYNRRLPVIRLVGFFLIKLLKKTSSGLLVNEHSINRIKAVMGKSPMVFAPSHRSYGDFILLSYVCYCFDIDIPVVAAGMDFHSMWLMGRVMRNCCAFFMRRSFGSDKLYWAVFGEYVSRLITDNDSPLEFFIEGTRSRSGKSLIPRFGFLSMVLEPFFRGQIDDITIVPITISYDRTLEESLFAYELLGVPKPKESTTLLLKALNVMSGLYGRTYVEFGNPVSVSQFFGSPDYRLKFSRCTESVTAKDERAIAATKDLAFRLVRDQQSRAVITPFNLIAVLLSNSLFTEKHLLTNTKLAEEVTWLKTIMENFGALVDFHGEDNPEKAVREAISVHKNLVRYMCDILMLVSSYCGPAGEEESYSTRREYLIRFATPYLMLQNYVNPCLHFLINPAILVVILQSLDEGTCSITLENLFKKYKFLRGLLSHEFVLYKAHILQDFISSMEQMKTLNLVKVISKNEILPGSNTRLQSLLSGLLQPFLFSYLVLCRIIETSPVPKTEKELQLETQKRVEAFLLSGCPIHPYSLSLHVYGCGMRSLESFQAVQRKKEGDATILMANRRLKEIKIQIDKYLPDIIRRPVNESWNTVEALVSQSKL